MKKVYIDSITFRDIIVFMVVLLISNYFWKFTVHGDETGYGDVTWFGLVLTPFFDSLVNHIAYSVYSLVRVFREATLTGSTIVYPTGVSSTIVWGCTPVKQTFIWLSILLAARGSWCSKIWYIPAGMVLIYIFNIFRIFAISILTEYHPEWFEVLHLYIFRFVFYGLIFLMWMLWLNVLVPIGKR